MSTDQTWKKKEKVTKARHCWASSEKKNPKKKKKKSEASPVRE